MFSGFILALREGVEAALVIGMVLGTLTQLRRADCAHVVWSGAGVALAVSVAAAVLFRRLGLSTAAAAEPVFEGLTLLAAALLLTWMVFWMARQSRRQCDALQDGVAQAVCASGGRGVFLLTFIAVAREGVELAFFLTAASLGADGGRLLLGAALGLGTAALLAWLLFATTIRMNVRRFFQLTSVALVLFAAGLVAKAIQEFNEAGWIPALIDPLWNSHTALNEFSVPGEAARILFGYTSTPSLTVVLGYAAYLAIVVAAAISARPAVSRRQHSPA